MKKRALSLLLVFVMVLSIPPTSVFAVTVGDGTAENPYQIGDIVTNDGSAEPDGYTVENAYWARTSDVPATENLVCQIDAHDHVSADCTISYEAVECMLEGHPTEGELDFTHEDGTVCSYEAEQVRWLTEVAVGYTCGIEAHTHTVEAGCITEVSAYTVWTLTQIEQTSPVADKAQSSPEPMAQNDDKALPSPELEPMAVEDEKGLPIHYFLASPGNIVNPNGNYVNYGTTGRNTWPESYVYPDIKSDPNWNQIQTELGIRNVYDETLVTRYVKYWPGNNAAAFKDFGSVTIDGTVYTDDKYEIKWVSIMYRDNNSARHGLYCSQYGSANYEHIHIDGLLVEKIQPGQMEVYKTIPSAVNTETTFRFTLQKMLQADLVTPPTSANAVDTSFTPMTLTASIPAGKTEAQITGGSEISFGYYKLTEISSNDWETSGIVLTDSNGKTQFVETDTLYICIAPNGTVQYSTTVSGPYTVMKHVAVQNERKDVTITYQWRVYNLDGTVSEGLPASVGAHGVPASVEGVKVGTNYVYNTGYVEGTSYHDYENGLLYTFHGWDTYSHSSVFNVDPSATGYTALDDGDANASNNKTIPITADTWINGYWTVSELPAADAYLLVRKNVVVASGDAEYVNYYLRNIGKMFIRIDPGIDKDGDGKAQIDVDYPAAVAEDGYKINVYQYKVPFEFTEYQADVPGYTKTVDITVSGSNLTLTAENGADATVAITEEYNPAQAPHNLGTVLYTNRYTKNVGTPVTEYPTLTLMKRAADTGLLQANAVFTLYSDKDCTDAITTFTTNSEGVAAIDFAPLLANVDDSYTVYLKETAAPDGYLVDNTVYTLTLTPFEEEVLRNNAFVMVTTYVLSMTIPANSNAEPVQNLADALNYSLTVYNRPIVGKLTVKKATIGLEEAHKELLEATVTIHGPIARNAQGEITSLGDTYTLTLNEDNEWTRMQSQLPIGEYLIHENMASVHGYFWDVNNVDYGELDKEVYNNITSGVFRVTADSTDIEVTITNTYEKWASADFYIYKIDPNGAPLSGATFQLYSDESCTTKVTDSSIVTSAVSGRNGYAWFRGYTVPANDTDGIVTYYLQETMAPAGYYLSDTVYRVDIKAVTDAEGTTTFEPKIFVKLNGQWVESTDFSNTSDRLTIVNIPVKGQITITKRMYGAPGELTSVTFYVSGPNGYAKTVELTKNGNWTATLTGLPLGEYTIIEQKADAPGYDLVTTYMVDGIETTDKATVVLRETTPGQTKSNTVFAGEAEISNTYTRREVFIENPTSLTVKKVGENAQPLAGAVFTMERLDADGETVIASISFTTGEDGTVVFDLLTGFVDEEGSIIEGKYILSETKAPDGYEPTTVTWSVTVQEDDGEYRIVLDENKNVFENFWDWIVGNVSPGSWENGVLTVTNMKKVGTLTITKQVDDPEGLYMDKEYAFTLDCSDDTFDKNFTLKAGETFTVENIPWGSTYTLNEDTTGAAFTATIQDSGDGLVWAERTNITVTNTYAYTFHNEPLSLVKVDADDNSKVISGAGFTLFADEALETKLGDEVFSDENGALMLPIEAAGIYYLSETTTPDGYHSNANVYVVTAEEKVLVKNAGTSDAFTEVQMHIRIAGLTGTTNNQIDYTYNIENTAIKSVVVNVEKLWDDGNYHARPEAVEVTLYRDDEVYETVTLNEANNWRYTWEELTDEYDWSVDEATVPTEYSKSLERDGDDWTITNSRIPKSVEITVTKAWNHNGGKDAPEAITITLYKNGESYDTVTLSAANNWTHTWTDLTDASVWSVDETDVPAGYTKQITVDGYAFVITNTRIVNPVEVSVNKVWVASEGVTHPASVEAVLYRDGEAYDTVVLNAKNGWSYRWTNLTDEYAWSVDEKAVPAGYRKNVTSDGYDFTITNTKEFEYIDVSARKIWYGTDVVHPDSVNVTLYRDGVAYETVTLSAANDWSHIWTNLTDEFEWTVDEPSVPSGYNKTVRSNGYNFIITNTHEDIPKTGDFTNLFELGTMTVVGVVGFSITALALIAPRKKEEEEQ